MHPLTRTSQLALVAAVSLVAALAAACPFCTVESRTLTEEINSSEAVVLARLVAEASPDEIVDEIGELPTDPDAGKATFEIVEVLRGQKRVKPGDAIKVVYFGEGERDRTFLVSGIKVEDDALEWTTPLPLSAAAIEYIRQLPGVAESGADRLAFFQDYFEHEDPLLAQDAYDEFARAPYAEVKSLKDRMHHDRLVAYIQSAEVNPSRRRLYLTMLGVCGDERDLPMLEAMIDSDYSAKKPFVEQLVVAGKALGGPIGLDMWLEMLDLEERQKKLGLDATVACYLTLRGPDGLDLIDDRFLKNPNVEYTHAYMTIMALRFHGEETDVIPRPRLLASMRLLLDNPEFADQVIPDLARWQDWSVLDRLVEMYKHGDEKSYIRQPVVTYLSVASEQTGEVGERAKVALADLETLDPEGVKRAKSLMAFGFLARARSTDSASGAARPESNATPQADTTAFAASPADRAEEHADASDLPDPAGERTAAYADESVDEEDTMEVAGDVPEDESPQDLAADEGPVVVADVESAPIPAAYSRSVVVGVPLASALVLLIVYWLILRWGAV